jgi:hypothetical protein
LLREGHALIEDNECFEIFPEPPAGTAGEADLQALTLTILTDEDPPTKK